MMAVLISYGIGFALTLPLFVVIDVRGGGDEPWRTRIAVDLFCALMWPVVSVGLIGKWLVASVAWAWGFVSEAARRK